MDAPLGIVGWLAVGALVTAGSFAIAKSVEWIRPRLPANLKSILKMVTGYGLFAFFIWVGFTAVDHRQELAYWYVVVGTSAVFLLIYKIRNPNW
jgi:hypothetical protein